MSSGSQRKGGLTPREREIHIGGLTLKHGVFIEALVQGRKYKVKIEEIDEYNTIIGKDPNDKDVMVRLSRIVALKTLSEAEFYGEERG